MDTKFWIAISVQLISFTLVAQEFYTGVDLSYVNELEDCGAKYSNKTGQISEPYEINKSAGSNLVRLRLWHNPDWTNYSNLEDVKISISKAKSLGMSVMLDFHYSDFWTDPGRQWRPDAWEDVVDDNILGDSVYNYTKKVLTELADLNLLPEFVQIGNETNGNILLLRNNAPLDSESPGLYPVNWKRQVDLLQRGIDAVNDLNQIFDADLKTIIHIANPQDASFWFQDALSNGLTNFDIIGLSYYPQWHDMGVREVGEYIARLKSQHNKDVMIVEIGYPWTTINGNDNANNVLGLGSRLFTYSNTFTIQTQKEFLIELTWLVKENGGLGVVYWEPAWVSSTCKTYWGTGSHWDNATLFDFDGKLHDGADFLSYDYSVMPNALGEQQIKFVVDMTAIEAEDGVYVTGDFTGSPWILLPMTLMENNLYELETTIPGRSTGAYIFYNDDEWFNENRETVPGQCAEVWDTHREYRVKGESATFHFSWGRCDQIPNEVILSNKKSLSEFTLYPTLAKNKITIRGNEDVIKLEIFDSGGKGLAIKLNESNEISVDRLETGLYLVRLVTQMGVHTLRFIKE
ncbi:MAG: arabinogalactan endo-1,4-beta-galactosidase [Cyclobacteriaceae bacterium]|jgi:arabinogalactan endo-1,4-beta-galactosidase